MLFHIKNRIIRFFLQEFRSPSRTPSPDLSFEIALQSKMQQHNLQEFIQNQEHTYQIFLQECSSIHDVTADFLSPLILSPLIYSIIFHRKIWHRHTLFQELSLFLFSAAFSPLLIFFSAVYLSSYSLGFIYFISNCWFSFIPTSVLFKT